MNAKWPMVPLGEVLTHRKEFIKIDDMQEYLRCRVQLHAKGIVLRDRVEGGLIKTKNQQVCHAGEFLVAEIDAKVGGFGIVPPDLDGSIVSSHYFLFCVNSKMLDYKFLDYFSKTPTFQEQVKAQGSTNYAAIRPQHVLAYSIPLPPLTEQRRIVEKIERLAAKVEETKGLRASADDLTKALSDRVAERLFNRAEEIGPVFALGDLVTLRGGGTPSKSNPLYWKGDIPWISPKDMKQRSLSDAIDHISKEATKETSAKLIEPGAVLVVVRGMILAHTIPSAMLQNQAAINQDIKALIPNNNLLAEYLCAVLWGWNSKLLSLIEKSTHDTRKFRTERLLAFNIPVPTIPEQKRILQVLRSLESSIERLRLLYQQETLEIDAIMPAILDQAFKGEL